MSSEWRHFSKTLIVLFIIHVRCFGEESVSSEYSKVDSEYIQSHLLAWTEGSKLVSYSDTSICGSTVIKTTKTVSQTVRTLEKRSRVSLANIFTSVSTRKSRLGEKEVVSYICKTSEITSVLFVVLEADESSTDLINLNWYFASVKDDHSD